LRFFIAFWLFLALSTSASAYDATGYVKTYARALGVPPYFALRIAKIESGARCGVHNRHSGATGPMQILPSTARRIGYRNIRGSSCATQVQAGMKYLSYCIKVSHGNLYNAARCYNGGPATLLKHHRGSHGYARKATR